MSLHLIVGKSGRGKSTFAAKLADEIKASVTVFWSHPYNNRFFDNTMLPTEDNILSVMREKDSSNWEKMHPRVLIFEDFICSRPSRNMLLLLSHLKTYKLHVIITTNYIYHPGLSPIFRSAITTVSLFNIRNFLTLTHVYGLLVDVFDTFDSFLSSLRKHTQVPYTPMTINVDMTCDIDRLTLTQQK